MLDLSDCTLSGSAIPEPFLFDGLERVVDLPSVPAWDSLRGQFRGGAARRVHSSITTRISGVFGYDRPVPQAAVVTREGAEDGGWMLSANGVSLRAWSVGSDTDLDAVGAAYRYSPTRIAQRVLLTRGERAGLLTNGDTVRLLLCDPARADSHLSIQVDNWRQSPHTPDSFRLLAGLAGVAGLPRLPSVLEAARLHQTKVTSALRLQARDAIEGFIGALPAREGSAAELWHDCLILVYRLLFILKLESAGGGFSFSSSRLWRTVLSPNLALGPLVRRHLDQGHDTGHMLEAGLRALFVLFRDGVACSELRIAPLGGALFGAGTTAVLDRQPWGDRAVAMMLDRLMWNESGRERARMHYGSLNVEDLGAVYEGLLELEPGIAAEPLVRIRRGKMEAFAPAAAKIPEIPAGQFFLRAGTGRKASGSFYTPREFVNFLVRETLEPAVARLSPPDDPHPARLLRLKIVDPACGSGHFLVEACRYVGNALLAACRSADELGRPDRLAGLEDVQPYLPTRGYMEDRARAICRRLVAVHCLYGCDRNKLALDLAKVSLWLESYAEGLPLTFLDHRLVHGDALVGPMSTALGTLPVTGGPLDPLLARGVAERLAASVDEARGLVGRLGASIGRDIDDLEAKQAVKSQLDAVLLPLRSLARAWAGAAVLRNRDSDDVWLSLATSVAEAGTWPDILTPAQQVLVDAGAEALPWDLTFPEVFPPGFSGVLGNPPWDVLLPNLKDFVAGYDPAILDATSRAERSRIEQAVLRRPGVGSAYDLYRSGFERTKNAVARLYRHQRTSGSLDLFRLFAERAMELTAQTGCIGLLLPSAFHANDGSAGVRRLYLQGARLDWCLSFENRRRIFDIDSRFKFDAIVAHRPGPTRTTQCGFYLERIEDAFDPAKILAYHADFLHRTSGESLTPLELRGQADLDIARTLFAQPERFGDWCRRRGIRFGCDLHMTADAVLFRPPGGGRLPLHEGKTFHQYTGTWDARPRYNVDPASLPEKVRHAIQHPRLAFRDIARSNDERTMIAFMSPPGSVFGHTATVEKTPETRSLDDASVLCAVFNSFTFDWLVRLRAATHLSLYLLESLPMPVLSQADRCFLAGAAGRLSGHPNAAERYLIDAMIGRAYGLTETQYRHVLTGFSHRSFPDAPSVCIDAFRTAGSRQLDRQRYSQG